MTPCVRQLVLVALAAIGLPAHAASATSAVHRSTSREASVLERLEGIERVDRALLPRLGDPVSIRVHALESLVVVDAPNAAPALVKALRLSPLAVCPDVDETTTGAVLHCRSRRIVAHLIRSDAGYVLDVAETRGLPWDGEDGAPIIAFDPREAGLGAGCPGSTPAGRAECLLARGQRTEAHALLDGAHGAAAEESVALRRGDLAHAQGDVLAATSSWTRARGRTWERLAAARLCELSWACIGSSRLDDVYATADLPEWAQRDLRVRHARTLAFLGRSAQAAEMLVASAPALNGCASARALCRDIAATALADAGPRSLDALALWLSFPDAQRSPAGHQATATAASVAEREGAPIFAANLLASAAGEVPTRLLREHLLRTAELYVSGGDLVRAGVIVEFARTRAGEAALAGPRWATVLQAIRATSSVAQGRAP